MFSQGPLVVQDREPSTPPKLPKAPPRDIEEWLRGEEENLTRDERGQWPLECSTSMTLLDNPLKGDAPILYQVEGDVFQSLEAVKADLEKHSPWDSSFLDAIDLRLQKVEHKLGWFADRFICEGHPLAVEGGNAESVAGGLRNITNRTFLTELCDMDLLNSRQIATGLKERMRPLGVKSDRDERTVDALYFGGTEKALSLPAKLEPLPILDLVTKAQIPANLSKSWKKVFFTDSSTSLLINAFWWIWIDYFKPDQSSQAVLFDVICENFVGLLNSMGSGQKDTVFMYYPDCLSQAIYSAFCQACPGSNKIINSEDFLDYLTNLISEWITGLKAAPGEWKRWPRHLLDPYHTTAHSKERPLSSARGTRAALTDKDVMSLSMSSPANQFFSQPPHLRNYRTQTSRVQFKHTQSRDRLLSSHGNSRLTSGVSGTLGSSEWGGPSRPTTAQSAGRRGGRSPHSRHSSGESTPTHIGPGPIFECVRFSILGRSPLLHHFMIRHNLTDLSAPSGPTISRRQVKEVPRPSISYKDLLRRSQETSDRKYEQYENEMAKSAQETVGLQKHHIAQLRKLEKQNKKILSHRHEVAILAERLLARKRAEQSTATKLTQEDP